MTEDPISLVRSTYAALTRGDIQAMLDVLDPDVERILPAGGRIVACLHQRGTSANGVPVDLRDGHVWTIEDGRVTRIELYLSHEAALAAAGATG